MVATKKKSVGKSPVTKSKKITAKAKRIGTGTGIKAASASQQKKKAVAKKAVKAVKQTAKLVKKKAVAKKAIKVVKKTANQAKKKAVAKKSLKKATGKGKGKGKENFTDYGLMDYSIGLENIFILKKGKIDWQESAATLSQQDIPKSKDPHYMNDAHCSFFRALLHLMRLEILQIASKTMHELKEAPDSTYDEGDRASKEAEFAVELRERERDLNFLRKIENSFNAIIRKEYGYCTDCGETIGIERMKARPVTTLCIDCKNFQEIRERRGEQF